MQWYFAAPSPISLSFPLPGKYPTEYLCIEKVKTFLVNANAFSTPSPNGRKMSAFVNAKWTGGSGGWLYSYILPKLWAYHGAHLNQCKGFYQTFFSIHE